MSKEKLLQDISFDAEKRIIATVTPKVEKFLQVAKYQQTLKTALMDTLKQRFVKLEVGKNRVRITVVPGTEEESMRLIEVRINQLLQQYGHLLKFL